MSHLPAKHFRGFTDRHTLGTPHHEHGITAYVFISARDKHRLSVHNSGHFHKVLSFQRESQLFLDFIKNSIHVLRRMGHSWKAFGIGLNVSGNGKPGLPAFLDFLRGMGFEHFYDHFHKFFAVPNHGPVRLTDGCNGDRLLPETVKHNAFPIGQTLQAGIFPFALLIDALARHVRQHHGLAFRKGVFQSLLNGWRRFFPTPFPFQPGLAGFSTFIIRNSRNLVLEFGHLHTVLFIFDQITPRAQDLA